MLSLGILLLLIGVIFAIFPKFIWLISESWKSEGATEPSSFYILVTRFGGTICIVIGIANVIVSFW